MIVTRTEGGIPYTEVLPDPNPRRLAAFERWLDSQPVWVICSCGGDAHAECRRCPDCGEAVAHDDYDVGVCRECEPFPNTEPNPDSHNWPHGRD